MAAEGGRIDFMFLGPPLPGRWIRYCSEESAVLSIQPVSCTCLWEIDWNELILFMHTHTCTHADMIGMDR